MALKREKVEKKQYSSYQTCPFWHLLTLILIIKKHCQNNNISNFCKNYSGGFGQLRTSGQSFLMQTSSAASLHCDVIGKSRPFPLFVVIWGKGFKQFSGVIAFVLIRKRGCSHLGWREARENYKVHILVIMSQALRAVMAEQAKEQKPNDVVRTDTANTSPKIMIERVICKLM